MLKWRATLYSGGFSTRGVEIGTRLGTGIAPLCPHQGEETAEPERLTVLRVVGVRPAIAVGVREYGGLYLAHGYVVESPRHPLHRAVFRRGSPNETRGWSCGPTFRRIGRVVGEPPNVVRIRYDGSDRAPMFFLDAETRFTGLDRYGVPYLGRGTRVTLTATRCTASGGRWKLVARSFVRVGDATLAG